MAQFLCSESPYTRQGMPTTRMHCDAGRVWRSLTNMPEGYANETALAMHSNDLLVGNLANILHDARPSPVIEPRHVVKDNMKSRPDIRATGATGGHGLLDVTVVHRLAPSLMPSFVDTLLARRAAEKTRQHSTYEKNTQGSIIGPIIFNAVGGFDRLSYDYITKITDSTRYLPK